ncbi:MAG: hypothetical protein HW389_2591, partial [Bacteroidetes bacterium]|nr:hypothetical protein [Bacteroidota bacterium]
IRNAFVRIQPSPVSQLRDTLLPRPDSGRYNFPIYTYVLSPFTPVRGRSYLVSASAPSLGTASASVSVPDKGTVYYPPTTTLALDNPTNSKPDVLLMLYLRLSWAAQGYICRMYLDYEYLKEGEWVVGRAEVPVSSRNEKAFSLEGATYPYLHPVRSSLMPLSSSKMGTLVQSSTN